MSKNKQGIPQSKVPIIGGDQMPPGQAQAVVEGLMMRLNPMIEELVQSLDAIDRRLQIVEAVHKIFPDSVTVVIKKEETEAWQENLENRIDKLERPGK